MEVKLVGSEILKFNKLLKVEQIEVVAEEGKVYLVSEKRGIALVREVEADITTEGRCTLSSYTLGVLPGEEIILTEKGISSEDTNIKFDVTGCNIKIAEVIGGVEEVVNVEEANKLKQILSGSYAMARDETRPILRYIALIENDAVCLDGYRLTIRKTDFNLKEQVLIIDEVVKVLKKLNGPFKIEKSEEKVIISIGETKVIFKNKKEEFINYKTLPPKDKEHVWDLEVKNILSKVKKCKKIGNSMITLIAENNELRLSSKTFGLEYEARVEKNIKGELKIGFNTNYLFETLKNIKDERVKVELKNSHSPAVFRLENGLDLVLPIRMSK